MKKEKQNKSAECPVRNTGIGGQAVIEGVMMRGEQGMALAVRDSEGVIRVSRKRMTPLSKKGFWFNFPVIRGAVRFVCNMIDGVKTLMKSADVFGESEPSKAEKWVSEKMHVDLMSVVTTFSLILGLALSVFLYIVLPNLILSLFQKLIPTLGEGWQQFILAFSKLAIMTAYLMLVSLMKDIKRTFMYHGAEHRTINCYEKGLPLTVENVQKQTTFHNRCGTTFLFLTILVSVFVSFLLGVDDPAWLRVLKRLATLPVTAGLAYELLKALAKTDFPLLYPLKLPGMLMQKITTRPPTDDMAEVAIASFLAALELDEDPNAAEFDFEQPRSYKQVRAEAEAILAGVDEADVDWIFCAALKSTRAALAMREKVSPKEYANIIKMAKERATGKPLQYILGNTCFYGYDFTVTPDVLIPRFETELLADYAIKLVNENSSVLDLCTGSGCIGITVQKKTGARVTLADISRKALAVAEQNAVALNAPVALVETDFFSNLSRSYDLITCNPPYIRTDDVELLSPTVRDYEPRIALDGGKDGLDCYRILAAEAARHLNAKGYLLLEVGMGQAQDVKALLEKDFEVSILKDFDRVERFIKARKRSGEAPAEPAPTDTTKTTYYYKEILPDSVYEDGLLYEPVTESNIPTLAAVADAVWHEAFPDIISEEQINYMLKKYQSPKAIARQFAEGFKYYFVKQNDQIIGYVGMQVQEDDILYLSKFYLLAPYRGVGNASRMMRFVCRYGIERNLKCVCLTTNRNNLRSQGFYEHIGFKKIFEEKTDIGEGFVMDDFIYQINLQ